MTRRLPNDKHQTAVRKVLITGAAGNLGGKLSRYLSAKPDYVLCLLDRDEDLAQGILPADLSRFDADWTRHLMGVDTVVHLAGKAYAGAPWDELIGPNIDASLNLYLAAAQAGVKRIILASSVWVLSGYRFQNLNLTPETPPDPGQSRYGASKLFSERIGAAFYQSHGLSTIVLRIGACARDNVPEKVDKTSAWDQACWLSDDDMCRGIEAAIESRTTGFEILNLMSNNAPERWDIRSVQVSTGFTPEDRHAIKLGFAQKLKGQAVRVGRDILPRLVNRLTPWDW